MGGGIGGGIGGKLGGGFGFGVSIAGTAIGAQFDAIIAKATVLGKALSNPIASFGELQQNALLSSKSLESYVGSLIAAGREAEAAKIIQQDLATSYGGAESAKKLVAEQDRLNRSYSQFSINLGAFALGPLADSASSASNALSGLRAILTSIGNFVPPPVREAGTSLGRNLAGQAAGFILGAPGIGPALNFLGQFAPKPSGAGGNPSVDPAAQRRAQELLTTQKSLIAAQTLGTTRQSLELERQLQLQQEAADIERLRATGAKQPEIDARRRQGELDRFRLQQEQQQYEADKSVRDVQRQLQSDALARGIKDAQDLLGTQGPRTRDQLQLRQQALGAANASRDQERLIGGQIDSLRQNGAPGSSEKISDLVKQQNEAAETTRLKLIEGADAITQAGKQLSKDLTDATLQLVNVRSSEGGLNQYLTSTQVRERAAKDFELLKPQFDKAKEQFTALTGADVPKKVQFLSDVTAFAGASTDTNKAISDFIQAVNDEAKAADNLADVQKALNANMADLAEVSSQLVKSTLELAAKDWGVYVTVNADGTSTAYGDAVNRAI